MRQWGFQTPWVSPVQGSFMSLLKHLQLTKGAAMKSHQKFSCQSNPLLLPRCSCRWFGLRRLAATAVQISRTAFASLSPPNPYLEVMSSVKWIGSSRTKEPTSATSTLCCQVLPSLHIHVCGTWGSTLVTLGAIHTRTEPCHRPYPKLPSHIWPLRSEQGCYSRLNTGPTNERAEIVLESAMDLYDLLLGFAQVLLFVWLPFTLGGEDDPIIAFQISFSRRALKRQFWASSSGSWSVTSG